MVAPMNYLKKITVLLVTFSIILLNTLSVNAAINIPTPEEELQFYRDLYNEAVTSGGYQSWLKRLSKKVFDNVGFMIDESGILIQKIKDAIHGADQNMPSSMTDEEAYNWVKSNLTVSDNIVANDSFNTFIKNYQTNYVNESSGKYYYAADLSNSSNYFGSNILQISNLLNSNPDCMFTVAGDENASNTRILGFKLSSNCYAVQRTKYSDQWSLCDFYYADVENGIITTHYAGELQSDNIITYVAPNSNSIEPYEATYPMINPYQHPIVRGYLNSLPDQSTGGSEWRVYPKCITNSRQGIMMFQSINDLNSYLIDYGVGKQAYYYNNSVWQDFSNTTGDYTFSPSNINTITYGDTVSYINDYHDTNNNYPDNSNINNWINTTNNNNTSGGGSGSGGDDSGGGSGGGGSGSGTGTDGIFDFLSDLGSVLGNLIKNLGQAITNIIKGISDLVSSIVTDLPTVFFDFIGSIFGWLPDEWVTLLSLSLAAMLIWGIVKVIRG